MAADPRFDESSASSGRRWWLAALAVVLLLLPVAAWLGWRYQHAQEVAQVPGHIERALAYRARGELSAAVVELKSALRLQPTNADARIELGQVYLDLGDGPAAEKEFRQAIAHGRSSSTTELGLLHARLLDGDFAAVLEDLEWLASSDPRAAIIEGEALLGLERPDAAEAAFKSVIADESSAINAWQGIAFARMAKQDFEAARESIDTALGISAKNARSWRIKADVEFALGELEAAVESAERALALRANHIGALLTLATAQLRLGRLDAADANLTTLEKADLGMPIAHYLRGEIAFRRDDLTRAKSSLRAGLAIVPDHAESLFLLASIQLRERAFEDAQATVETLLASEPDVLRARVLLAEIQLERKNPAAAVRTLRTALAEHPADEELASRLATALTQAGDFDAASRVLARVSMQPGAGDPRRPPVDGRGAAGVSDASVDDTGSSPNRTRAELLRGAIFLERREYQAALDLALNMSEALPDSPLPSQLMGNAHEGLGDSAAATRAYEKALEIDPSFTAATSRLAALELRASNPEGAEARYRAALDHNPDHPELLEGLARIALDRGDVGAWVELLERSRRHNPDDVQSRLSLTRFYLGSRPEAALAPAGEALAIDEGDEDAVLLMARAEIANRKLESALRRLSTLVKAHPESAGAHFHLAHARELAGQLDGARAGFEKALDLDGAYFDARIGLGRVYVRQGQVAEAVEIARTAQRTHPDRAEGHVLEGDAHRRERRAESAIASYRAALERRRDAAIVISLASAYWDAGDRTKAEQSLRAWLVRHPEDVTVRKELAQIGILTDDLALSVSEYERILETTPDDVDVLNNLAYLYHEQDDPRARELAERAYELAPQNPSIMDTYGWILAERGDLTQGVSILQASHERSPDDPAIRLHLGKALLAAGENLRAREVLVPLVKARGDAREKREARKLLGLD